MNIRLSLCRLCALAYILRIAGSFLRIIPARRVCAWRSAGRLRVIQEIAKVEAYGMV